MNINLSFSHVEADHGFIITPLRHAQTYNRGVRSVLVMTGINTFYSNNSSTVCYTRHDKIYDQWMIGELHRQLWKGTQYDRYSHMSRKYMSSVSDSHYQNQTQSRVTICVTLLEI